MAARVMYDTDQPASLQPRAAILATYADLATVTLRAELARAWPLVLWIDRGQGDPMGLATIIDIETGTHAVGDAAPWFDREHATGKKFLTVYCNRSTLPLVDAAMGARPFYRWVATLDGTTHIDGHRAGFGPAAVQNLSAAMLGFHADGSLVFEDSWHPQAPLAWLPAAAALSGQLDKTLRDHL